MSERISPHGGQLVDHTVAGEEMEALRQRAASLPNIRLNARSLSDLELLGSGGYSPLRGFIGRANCDSVVESTRLASGLPWPIPIFSEFAPGERGIAPMFFDNTFFCKRCAGRASANTCPYQGEDSVILSGMQVRDLLKGGLAPPPEFSRLEVAEVLIQAMKERTTPHYAV